MNNEVSPYHLKARKPGYIKYYHLEALEEESFIGGLTASIYWNCMEVDDFYIEEGYRKKQIGTQLLKQAIYYAKGLKLEYVWLKTFSFQAKDFYLKFGFKVVGELTNYPPPYSLYTMKLNLN